MIIKKLINPIICIILITVVASCTQSNQKKNLPKVEKKVQINKKSKVVHHYHDTAHHSHIEGAIPIKPANNLDHRVNRN